MRQFLIFLIALSIFNGSGLFLLKAQIMPEMGLAFPQSEVTTIRIIIDPDSLQQMIDLFDNVHDYPAKFIYESSALIDTIDTIGFRLKGNTSLSAAKKSFKLSFDAFDNNQEWLNLDKLNLIGQHNDPSMLRSKLCHDMYRYYGIPSERTSFTRLYINDEYRGLYVNTEQIDKKFAKLYFDSEGAGNLYKCTYPANLDFISTNPEDYKNLPGSGGQAYDLKTNKFFDDYSDLAHFIDVLVNTPIASLECELPKVFNVESYLKTAAIDILTGNWDGYIFNMNNYYLYKNDFTGQFNYMPYDLDNTLGLDWLGIDWANRNIYQWPNADQQRPLFNRLMEIPAFRERFTYHIDYMSSQYLNDFGIGTMAHAWQDLIATAAEEDIYRTLDYGFTIEEFQNAIDSVWGAQISYGIMPYASTRSISANNQMENFFPYPTAAIPQWLKCRIVPEGMLIEGMIAGQNVLPTTLRISSNGIDYSETTFTDAGGLYQVANDGIYSFLDSNWPVSSDKYYYQIETADGDFYPCEPAFFWVTASAPGLFINEVMALNNSIIFDEGGVYEDWVELYNSTNSPINLQGKFLSDDSTNLNKFALPNLNIPSHGFVLVWLDNDIEQSPLHANFKLSVDESIYLSSIEEGEIRKTDMMQNLSADADVSLELISDGGTESAYTSAPTPGYTNNSNVFLDEHASNSVFVYPNPANDILRFSQRVGNAELIDATGRIVLQISNSMAINTASVASGIYFLKLDNIIARQIIQH